MKRNIAQSTATGLILGIIVLLCTFYHPILFTILLGAFFCFCVRELSIALKSIEINAPTMIVLAGGILMLVATLLGGLSSLYISYIMVIFATGVYTTIIKNTSQRIWSFFAGVFEITYLALLCSFMVATVRLDGGPTKFVFGLLLVIASDTGGLIFGSRFGKHKITPYLSPGKTWEGFFGSILSAILVATACMLTFYQKLIIDNKVIIVLLYAVMIVITSTVGDLIESAIKRDVKLKDMGNLLAGHGGFLDRLDSALFSAPFIYYFSLLVLQ